MSVELEQQTSAVARWAAFKLQRSPSHTAICMTCPAFYQNFIPEVHDESTNEFALAEAEGRLYCGDVYSDYDDYFFSSPISETLNSQTFSDANLSPAYESADSVFTDTGPRANDVDEFLESDSELLEYEDDARFIVEHFEDMTTFSDESLSTAHDVPVQVVGTTYTANLNSNINLPNLARTFKYSPSESLKKENNIPKKIIKGRTKGVDKSKASLKFKNCIPFKMDLAFFGMDGFASGNIFSNGKVLLSSLRTDEDEHVKAILKHIAQCILEAHSLSITNYEGAPVILSNLMHPFCIIDDSLSISPQLQVSVPFRIKYSRVDEAFQNGMLVSTCHQLIPVKSKKENATGHGYLVTYDRFSVTIYHTGMIQARTFKPHLTRKQLKDALLLVRSTLMSIQPIIEVQGDDTFDGSKRRIRNPVASKLLSSPSLFKSKRSLS